MKYFSSYIAGLLLCALLFMAGTATALADGTEQLGPPQGVTIATGSGLTASVGEVARRCMPPRRR